MPKLRILSKHEDEYRRLIEAAHLPDLEILSALGLDTDILFGEPNLIRDALASFPNLKCPVWDGHPEYTSDGIHPTAAGSTVTGDAIWEAMVEHCIAQ